jgi:hypothetical protein
LAHSVGEFFEEFSDTLPGFGDGAFSGFTQEGFQLGEGLFDRILVGAVGREKE